MSLALSFSIVMRNALPRCVLTTHRVRRLLVRHQRSSRLYDTPCPAVWQKGDVDVLNVGAHRQFAKCHAKKSDHCRSDSRSTEPAQSVGTQGPAHCLAFCTSSRWGSGVRNCARFCDTSMRKRQVSNARTLNSMKRCGSGGVTA